MYDTKTIGNLLTIALANISGQSRLLQYQNRICQSSFVVSEVAEIKEESMLLKVEASLREAEAPLRHRQDEMVEIANDYVFIFAGGIPPFKQLNEMGIQFGGEAGKNLV